jgi:ketosteroid isomerase-like protein
MSQENIDRLRANLEAFNRTGEINVDDLAPDFEMHQASSIVDTAGVFKGRDALQKSLRELQEAFDGITAEGEQFLEAAGGEVVVVVRMRGRGRGSGMAIDNRIAWVWTFRDAEAVRLVVYEDPAEAFEAVGLRE